MERSQLTICVHEMGVLRKDRIEKVIFGDRFWKTVTISPDQLLEIENTVEREKCISKRSGKVKDHVWEPMSNPSSWNGKQWKLSLKI